MAQEPKGALAQLKEEQLERESPGQFAPRPQFGIEVEEVDEGRFTPRPAAGTFDLPQVGEGLTPGARFIKGVGGGLVHPVRALIGPKEAEEDLGVAGVVGELVGAGLTFIPLYKGASIALKGVGLLKTGSALGARTIYFTPLGQTPSGLRGARIAQGALAFGGFEAFGGETVGEAPKRFVRGLAEGVAFEAAFAGIAAGWRARAPKWKPSEAVPAPTPGLVAPEVAVNPLALKLEYAMHPKLGDSSELIVGKLKTIGTPEEQLHESFMTLMKDFMPGGQALMPGLTGEEVGQLSKKAGEIGRIELRTFQPIKGEDLFEVMMIDLDRTIFTPEQILTRKPTVEGLVTAIRQRYDDVVVEFPKRIPSVDDPLGRYNPRVLVRDVETARIQVATDITGYETGVGLGTLTHELQHHITESIVSRRFGVAPGAPLIRKAGLEDVFNINLHDDATWKSIIKEAKLELVRDELKMATEETVTNLLMLRGMTSRIAAVRQAREIIQGNLGHYHADHELMPRMLELIVLSPLKAKAVAPRATKLIGGLLQREAPAIRELLSKESQVMLDIFNDMWRVLEPSGVATVWKKGSPTLTKAALAEYEKFGWAPGMRSLVSGKDFEYLARSGRDEALVRSLDTGAEVLIPLNELQRPVLQNIARRDEEVFRAIDGMLDEFPNELPLNVLADSPEIGLSGVRRSLVDVRDYEVIDGSVSDWVKGLPQSVQDQLTTRFGQLRPRELGELAGTEDVEFLFGVLDTVGKKGLVRRDNGLMEVLVKDRDTLIHSNLVESVAFDAPIAGVENALVYTPSVDDWLRHQLRVKGVNEMDLPYYFDVAYRRLGNRLEALADAEVKQVRANVEVALKKGKKKKGEPAEPIGDSSSESLARAGIESERLPDGRRELRDSHSKSVLGTVADEDEALAYVNELTSHDVGTELGSFPGGTNHGGNGLPPRPNDPVFPNPPVFGPKGPVGEETLGAGSLLADAQTLFLPVFSAFENVARVAERHGLGPAYTKVFLPAQKAMMEVQAELSTVARDAFGGLTYKDKMLEIQRALAPMSQKRHSAMTGYIEAVSKEEIARPGGLMVRAMTPNEIRVAQNIEALGMANDIPRLMSTDRLITAAVKGKLPRTINQMKQMELSPEAQQVLAAFESMPKFKNRSEVMDFLGLTAEERSVLKIIRESKGADKDAFSIYAVSRYASAPKLKKGFKTGREQFAFENKMTRQEIKVASLSSEALEAGFRDSGLDPKRHLTGYWPHLRMWVKEGYKLDKRTLPDDVVSWLGDRYRTGELNVYETDPLIGVYRQLRGLYMKKHFDPIMPEVKAAIDATKRTDTRIGRLMDEYVMELMGKPHASFDKLQSAISTTLEVLLGRKPSDRLANDIISGLSALASAALIPFRPALIARNFFESLLKVSPRVGVSHYARALKYVVSPETRQEAFRMAMDAKAIRPGTTKLRSLHGAEELFGPTGPRQINKALRIFDKGYEWYQSSDDWGRAIAFHAQRLRIMDNMPEYLRTGNLSKFKSQAKINTFDPLNIQIAEKHILDGNFDEAANHLGQKLAEETMTRYGFADHPAGWNSVQGRLFGQFGTWPVQYKDYLLQGITRGSAKDRIEFTMIHAGISGSIVAAGASIGINLKNWTGAGIYTGGPYADMLIDVVKSVSGSDTEKQLARMNLYGNIPILGWMETGNPRSIFLPGSYLLGDLQNAKNALEDGELFNAVMSGSGVRVMRPDEESPLKWLYRF